MCICTIYINYKLFLQTMNFLAHTHLSQNNEDVIFGNFIADSVKGKSYLKYRTDIITGILLHRNIDLFTDRHLVVKNSK